MRSILPLSCLLAVGFFGVPSAAQVSFETELHYGSPYVWRGQVLSTGFVVQPTVSASRGGFSLSIFGSVDPRSADVGHKVHLQELDLTAAYVVSVTRWTVGGGYTLYTFPLLSEAGLQLQPVHEVFVVGTLDLEAVRPSLLFAYDFNGLEGTFAFLSLERTVSLGGHPFAIAGGLGIDSGYLLEGVTRLAYSSITAETDVAAGGITLRPLVGFQHTFEEAYRRQSSAFGHGRSLLFGGLSIGI